MDLSLLLGGASIGLPLGILIGFSWGCTGARDIARRAMREGYARGRFDERRTRGGEVRHG